jgi:hypothetical protein
MFQTFTIYFNTMLVMMIFGYYCSNKSKLMKYAISYLHLEIVIPVLLFSTIFGLRYDVGVDYLGYLNIFNLSKYQDISHYYNYGFRFIVNIFSNNGYHFAFYFFTIAFLQISLFFRAFRDQRYLLIYVIFILFTGRYFIDWMNIMRQSLAFLVFMNSIIYIEKKSLLKYLLCILIAFSLHKSAIFLIILYPLLAVNRFHFGNRVTQLAILFIALYFRGYQNIFSILPINDILNMIGYENYIYHLGLMDKSFNTGIGFILILSIDIIIILYSRILKNFYASHRFTIHYNIYYFGVILYLLLMGNHATERIALYFISMKLLIVPYLLYYLINRSSKLKYISLSYVCMVYSLLFVNTIISDPIQKAQYIFFWQS